jgi:serine phosphatase RsbU (regulator of sigma subunit)
MPGIIKVKDGMEGSVISYDPESGLLNFSGTCNPIIHIHDHELKEIKADRMSIGYYEWMGKFTLKTINIEKGDIIYLYSDGYVDQFGGTESKKIMSKRFREMLYKNHNLPLASQKAKLLDYLNNWKGDGEQTDDILLAGIRF